MHTLDVQARLDHARAGVALLRALATMNKTMRYHEFAAAIGLKAHGKKWEAWHRTQTTDILNLIAAAERQAGRNTGTEPLRFELIVNERGEPGAGFTKRSRIVTEKPGIRRR